jgi:hypothetical protein
MRLYIQLENGLPLNHPIQEDNMRMAFPEVDLDNPGPNFAPFERYDRNLLRYDLFTQNFNGFNYVWKDNIITEIPIIEEKTEQEKINYIENIKQNFYNSTKYYSWTYDLENKIFVPPVPMPEKQENVNYLWNEEEQKWDTLELES